ncbi:hypothetical protein P9112_002773 [Eukaryota sp. TZLM1-RC]
MNILLVIGTLVVFVLLLIINSSLIQYFQHSDDKGQSYLTKFLIHLSFLLAEGAILLLPVDIINARDPTFPMDLIWQVVFVSMLVLTSFILPFTLFWYESLDEHGKTHAFKAFCFVLTTFFFLALGIFLLFSFFGRASIPISVLTSSMTTSPPSSCECINCVSENLNIDFYVTFPLYIIACFTLLGWFLFVLFGSIGIASLPMDLLNAYRTRPRKILTRQYAELKSQIADRASKLLIIANAMSQDVDTSTESRMGKKELKLITKFKQQVLLLEEEHKHLQIAGNKLQYQPFKYFGYLVLALLGLIVSLGWAIHIFVYVMPSKVLHPFLNTILLKLDSSFPLFGIILYGFFAFYLLLCVYKGTFKFGFRFFFIPIHPMEKGNTLLNSFLFNLILILLTIFPVIQFCILSFREYARLTSVSSLFGVTFNHLMGFSYFWDFYIYGLVGLSIISFLFLFFFPGRKSTDLMKELEDSFRTNPDL